LFAGALDYIYQSTPRTHVGNGVYTATEYPATQVIPQHCENAYQRSWPLRLYFFCAKAAAQGGETPIGDVRKVTAAIPHAIRARFKALGVRYVRNYSPGLDLSWQTVFQTAQRSAVEKYCVENDMACEWKADGSLRTSQVCQGTAVHPVTGEELWFNQAHLFHVSNLDAPIRNVLLGMFKEEDLPRNAYYGDGSPIEPETLALIRAAYAANKFSFAWREGDVLWIDNMLCTHGRNAYLGERKVLVVMSSPAPQLGS
jgi:alpha-ketoglutarate-dependent taurine dioxygenase